MFQEISTSFLRIQKKFLGHYSQKILNILNQERKDRSGRISLSQEWGWKKGVSKHAEGLVDKLNETLHGEDPGNDSNGWRKHWSEVLADSMCEIIESAKLKKQMSDTCHRYTSQRILQWMKTGSEKLAMFIRELINGAKL